MTKTDRREKGRRDETTEKLGTWNLRGIGGKEEELNEEFMKTDLSILAITETKKKGQGERKYVPIWRDKKAQAEVRYIVKKEWKNKLKRREFIGKIIMWLEFLESKKLTTVIIVYGPDENETVAIKD